MAPDRLGVGILYNPALPLFLASDIERVDFVEIIPDMFWINYGIGASPRYVEQVTAIQGIENIVKQRPVTLHSIGLSVGSAGMFDCEHVDQISNWQKRFGFAWHSDHLSFNRIGLAEHESHAGLAVPIPYDYEVLDLVSERICAVMQKIDSPFLLENNVYYVDLPDQELTEPQFLNLLCARTKCGLLLDLHNVYTNARNHGFRAESFIDELCLDKVVELHIAGGDEMQGMYTDSHAGPVPEPVWSLLDYVLERAANIRGVTFEFHESYYPLLKREGICEQLSRAREVWNENK